MSSNMTKFKQRAYKGVIKTKFRLQNEVWTDVVDAPIKKKKKIFSLTLSCEYPVIKELSGIWEKLPLLKQTYQTT